MPILRYRLLRLKPGDGAGDARDAGDVHGSQGRAYVNNHRYFVIEIRLEWLFISSIKSCRRVLVVLLGGVGGGRGVIAALVAAPAARWRYRHRSALAPPLQLPMLLKTK